MQLRLPQLVSSSSSCFPHSHFSDYTPRKSETSRIEFQLPPENPRISPLSEEESSATMNMASLPQGSSNFGTFCRNREIVMAGVAFRPFLHLGSSIRGRKISNSLYKSQMPLVCKKGAFTVSASTSSSNSNGGEDDSSEKPKKPFGYNRKDVLLIGVGVTLLGVGLKSGLEYAGVESTQAGNAVQLIIVLGLTLGWISTYIFRVSNKEMTYAQQLRDYEDKVMQKRLESLSEAELEELLEQVDEEKTRLASGERVD